MKLLQMPRKSFLLIVLCMFLCLSCTDDDNTTSNPQNQGPDPTTFSENFGDEISRDFLGTIVDINGNPIENVMISIGSSTAMTDSNGVFIINNATVNQRFGYIKAEKAGYIHASRAVVPSQGTNKVRIMMLSETVVGTTASGTQETINLPNGASVALEGDYIKPDGTAYDGSVNVIMHLLDPVDENMQDQMPGMLYAANAQNEERMLQTFGMLAVELRGENGEDLNLTEGSTAEIKIPLDPSLMTNAPSSIPLWYFDEANGYWIEEGQATLVGNTYVGTVSHFSFWNCDIPAEYVDFCVTVFDSESNPIANTQVTLTSSNYGTTSGYTNENGETCGVIPSGETLEINVYSYDICGQSPIYSETIGPFVVDSAISITILDGPETISETVTGIFNDCSGNPVTDGYILMNYGGQVFTDVVEDGNFEFNLIRCESNNTFSIKGSDYVNLQVTDSISYTFTTPVTNIGTISACNTVTEFVQYTIDDNETEVFIDGFEVLFAEYNPNYDAPTLAIFGSGENCFYLQGVLNGDPYIGTYDYYEWNGIIGGDTGFNISECNDISSNNNNIIFNFTTLGDTNEYIDINFSGSYEDSLGVMHTINGIIHVLRDN
ncbi:Ig-like domain-containing protein [uncultured Psychroserpens sp.]|uniref:Ig-like domain-containing protein n=1 Tax=uncultured Psychroserpens sp. TaxID=255436 RepID=UPI00260AD4FA|nr:Ig-like domain-containing protein [uncultured Psychroserpens sp.]